MGMGPKTAGRRGAPVQVFQTAVQGSFGEGVRQYSQAG